MELRLKGAIGSEGKKLDWKIALMAVTIIVVLILGALTFAFPDRGWEIRTDLEVGDYYILWSERYETIYTIKGVDGDDYIVEIAVCDNKTGETTVEEDHLTKKSFLDKVLYGDRFEDSEYTGAIYLHSFYGSTFCKIYGNDLNKYYVDEYGVIYFSSVGGYFFYLAKTSLFYGDNQSDYEPSWGKEESS